MIKHWNGLSKWIMEYEYLWRYSKPKWTWFWANCCSWPCLSENVGPLLVWECWTRKSPGIPSPPGISSNLRDFVILSFFFHKLSVSTKIFKLETGTASQGKEFNSLTTHWMKNHLLFWICLLLASSTVFSLLCWKKQQKINTYLPWPHFPCHSLSYKPLSCPPSLTFCS